MLHVIHAEWSPPKPAYIDSISDFFALVLFDLLNAINIIEDASVSEISQRRLV